MTDLNGEDNDSIRKETFFVRLEIKRLRGSHNNVANGNRHPCQHHTCHDPVGVLKELACRHQLHVGQNVDHRLQLLHKDHRCSSSCNTPLQQALCGLVLCQSQMASWASPTFVC